MLKLFQVYKEGFYAWIRRNTRPLSIEEAEEKKYFWAKIYAATTWSVLGYMTYLAFKGEMTLSGTEDFPKDIGVAVALKSNEEVRYIKYRGFKKVDDFTYSRDDLKKLVETKHNSNDSNTKHQVSD